MDEFRFRLRILLILLLGIVASSVLGFMVVERLSLPDAIYFCIVTVATVGYGDIHPVTPAGKLLAIFLILAGGGVFLGVVANTIEFFMSLREKRVRLEKLNIIIGIFFSEAGTDLMRIFAGYDPRIETIRGEMVVTPEWSDREFDRMHQRVKGYPFEVEGSRVDLEDLRAFLLGKGDLFLRLLENPNLLEHEEFTDLLRAILHLREELLHRKELGNVPETDREHLVGDIKRGYALIVHQWLDYMKHLKKHFPYLFSLSMRINPFKREASAVVNQG